jgi:hypothetical protein
VAARRGELATAEAEHRASLDAIPPDAWQRPGRTSGLIDVLVEAGELDEAEAILTAGGWQGPLSDDRETNVLRPAARDCALDITSRHELPRHIHPIAPE